jgi:hypothetical protein
LTSAAVPEHTGYEFMKQSYETHTATIGDATTRLHSSVLKFALLAIVHLQVVEAG